MIFPWDDIPLDFESIKTRDDKSLWLAAIDEELKALAENETWDLIALPNNKNPIRMEILKGTRQD